MKRVGYCFSDSGPKILTLFFMPLLLAFFLLSYLATPCSAQGKQRPLSPVKNIPGLPRVLLIGDSISIGYTLPTRQALQGVANVHRIPTNGGPTSKGLENIDSWLGSSKWDVIHFNWGLHDLCYRHPNSTTQGNRDKANGSVTHSLQEYAANLEKLVVRMKRTGARLIFATTTPVPEGEAGRKKGDDFLYNRAALAVMRKHEVGINDLHALMANRMSQFGIRPGNVHFTAEGSIMLAGNVSKALKEVLLQVKK
ncbi:MAG TPA: SGNH/GDSL hydrolase family protein [Verrucomicrobiales bacterium]|nr:SGNH/GDSL hydrolase family protein [Verrucomicrobiales bacterium]